MPPFPRLTWRAVAPWLAQDTSRSSGEADDIASSMPTPCVSRAEGIRMSLEEAIEMKPELEAAKAQTADMVRASMRNECFHKRRLAFPKLVLFIERAPMTLGIAIAMDSNKMQRRTHACFHPACGQAASCIWMRHSRRDTRFRAHAKPDSRCCCGVVLAPLLSPMLNALLRLPLSHRLSSWRRRAKS